MYKHCVFCCCVLQVCTSVGLCPVAATKPVAASRKLLADEDATPQQLLRSYMEGATQSLGLLGSWEVAAQKLRERYGAVPPQQVSVRA